MGRTAAWMYRGALVLAACSFLYLAHECHAQSLRLAATEVEIHRLKLRMRALDLRYVEDEKDKRRLLELWKSLHERMERGG